MKTKIKLQVYEQTEIAKIVVPLGFNLEISNEHGNQIIVRKQDNEYIDGDKIYRDLKLLLRDKSCIDKYGNIIINSNTKVSLEMSSIDTKKVYTFYEEHHISSVSIENVSTDDFLSQLIK